MRISYTYRNYPNCPRATEFSKTAASFSASLKMFTGLMTMGAAITLLVQTFSFFGNYNWGDFLGTIVFVIGAGFLCFYSVVIRPNNIECEINVILTEDCNKQVLTAEVIVQLCKLLRQENKERNQKAFNKFFPIFVFSLFDVVAFIATIKGVYYLCHQVDALFLFLGGVIAVLIFSYLILRLVKNPSSESIVIVPSSNNEQSTSAVNSTENSDIAFCRKCGTKVLSDSVFCAKCGTKVR